MESAVNRGVAEEDLLRARFYGLLANLLVGPPDAATLGDLATLGGDDSPLGRALGALGTVAGATSVDVAEDEYNALFIGLTRGELVPYASYYLTGFLNEKPLAVLRRDLAVLGIERAPDRAEPEDHIGFVCEVMYGLVSGLHGPASRLDGEGEDAQRRFFNTHLDPWAEAFFSDLKTAPSARLYRPVADIGHLFLGIEREAFSMRGDADAP